ncbi:MAG TPA: hypothetical protein VJB90_00355, partial [Candidatus Nanoarchaeia archaeon]|nr:hypothetical protein [Candidatus Nanoarchaeia archaeon]
KPGDEGEDTISIHIEDNDAWACMDLTLTKDDDVDCTEPELADDPLCTDPGLPGNTNSLDGELGSLLQFVFWTDDGDNVLETGESVIASGSAAQVLDSSMVLADSIENNVGGIIGDPLTGGQTYYIGKAWCFGTLTQNPVAQGSGTSPIINSGVLCDGSLLDNASQTDSLVGDISFSAVQHRNNPNFTCDGTTPSITPTPTPPIEISCEEADAIFASSFSNNDQGLRKDSSAVLAERSVPGAAFGAPESTGVPVDPAVPFGSFFSLGFPLSGNTASIVFGFAEPFYNGPGLDLQVFEVTGATTPPYPDEKVKIEASKDSIVWTLLAASAIRDEAVDLGVLDFANFVRLTDVSNMADVGFPSDADGYDVDAIKAFCTEV